MRQFTPNPNQYGPPLDAPDPISFPQYSLPEISLQQIQQLQGQQPQSPSANSIISNTPGPSQRSSPSMPGGISQTYNPVQFYGANTLNQSVSNTSVPPSSIYPEPSPVQAHQQFHPVFQSSNSSLNPSLIEPQNFNLVYPLSAQNSGPQSMVFPDPSVQNDTSQPYTYLFQPSAEVKSSVVNYPDVNLYSATLQQSQQPPSNNSSTFQAPSSVPRSTGVSPVPSGLEVLESSHAKHHKNHLRIKPHLGHAEISKKSPHAGHFSHHNSVSGISGISPSSSAPTPTPASVLATSTSTASTAGPSLRTSPNYPCPEDWAPLPIDYYANVPDFYPPIPPPNASGAASGSTNSSGATTRLDGTDLEFYLESLTIYPRLLYEISTEHGATLFSRKMSWLLFERSGKVYHELLSGRRLRNTFLHRISRYENRKKSNKDGTLVRKGAKGEKGSGYRTYSPKIDRLLGQILDLQNHLRESKLSYYEQKHRAESARKTKRDAPLAAPASTAANNLENKDKTKGQSLDFSSRNADETSQQSANNAASNDKNGPNFDPGPFATNFSLESGLGPQPSGSSHDDYLGQGAEKETVRDFPMPAENCSGEYRDAGAQPPNNGFSNLSSIDTIRVDLNSVGLAVPLQGSPRQFARPQELGAAQSLQQQQQQQQQQPGGRQVSPGNKGESFYTCTHPHLHHHPTDPGYYSRVMKDMQMEVQKAIEDAIERVKTLELGQAQQREQSYNRRLNDVSQKLSTIERRVDELKNVVDSFQRPNDNARYGPGSGYKPPVIFDEQYIGSQREFSDFGYEENAAGLQIKTEESPITSGAIDDEEIDRLLQKEKDRQEQQEIQKRARSVVEKLTKELLHEKEELQRSVAESQQMGLCQGAVSQTGSPNAVQSGGQQDVVNKSVSLEHGGVVNKSVSLEHGGVVNKSVSLEHGGVVNKSASLEHGGVDSPGQQKLPRVGSLHNSPAGSSGSGSGGGVQSPGLLSKESPGQNVQESRQVTPTPSNTVNLLSVCNSNTSEGGLGKAEPVVCGGEVGGPGPGGSLRSGDRQNSNFGLNFLKGFGNDDDENAFHEIEGSEDDEEGDPDISECV